MGSIVQSFSLTLILGTGCLDIGECGCFEFELIEGHWRERKSANSCRSLDGRKAGSNTYMLIGQMTQWNEMVGHAGQASPSGRAPKGSYFSNLGQICDREQHIWVPEASALNQI